MVRALIVCVTLIWAASVGGQTPLVSPAVSKGNRVTFRLKMPYAHKVLVELEAVDTHFEMTKDSDGIWSATTGVLSPQIYGYFFVVDGVILNDPQNPMKVAGSMPESLVLVPGEPPQPWEVQDVPHGETHHHWYESKSIGDQSEYFVYTPPGYATGSKFPVLYLLHGNGDTAAANWLEVGKANTILDNLIAAGKARPMVLVMPNSYGLPRSLTSNGLRNNNPNLKRRSYENFREALITEVIPQVEAEYKVARSHSSRAIAGLSMGGRETLFVSLNDPSRFAYIGAFSSGTFSDNFDADFPHLNTNVLNRKVRLLMISCGSEDRLWQTNGKLKAWLRNKGVHFEDVVTRGKHEWPVWRNNLIHFCQEIFRQ